MKEFKKLLIDKNISIKELSKNVGVSRQYIHWGIKNKKLSQNIINKISKELNITAEELLKMITE
jgi:DNA-binding Xre family transcriptional regulator